jgi:undecaprenyl-diphosphatase
MDYFISIIFGLVQGATEFLPVSSSGHLVILHSLLPLPLSDALAFDIALHLATLLAVVWVLRSDIARIAVGWFNSFFGERAEGRIGWLLIFATIPAGVLGYFFEKTVEEVFRNPLSVAFMLFVVGLLFIYTEAKARQEQNINDINFSGAGFIGLAQALALIPGTSRSGITIIAGMTLGLKRSEAMRFSFLLSIPIILGASLKNFPVFFNSLDSNNIPLVILAFISAFISAFIAVKFLLKFASSVKLNIFAYYRFILALIIVVYWWLGY